MPGKHHKPNAADYVGRGMCMPQIVSVRCFYLMLSKNGKLVTRAKQPSASDCGRVERVFGVDRMEEVLF